MQEQINIVTTTVSEASIGENSAMTLYEACKDGDLELVKSILQAPGVEIDEIDDDDWAPLHHAIHGGHVDLVKYLVEERGAKLETVTATEEGQEALLFAITDGHLDVVKYLSQNGGHHMMNEENDSQTRPIHFASLDGHFDIVRYLVKECNVDVDATDDDDWTALHYACLAGSLETVRYLAEEHDLDCDVVEVDGWTPLLCAVNKGHTNIVKYLLEEQKVTKDALVESCDQNALHLAASEGLLDAVKYLVEEAGFDILEPSSDDDTAFHLAARYGMLNVITYLVERCRSKEVDLNSYVNVANANDETAYDIAVYRVEMENEYANPELVEYLSSFIEEIEESGSEDEDEETMCLKMISGYQLALLRESLKSVEDLPSDTERDSDEQLNSVEGLPSDNEEDSDDDFVVVESWSEAVDDPIKPSKESSEIEAADDPSKVCKEPSEIVQATGVAAVEDQGVDLLVDPEEVDGSAREER